MPPPSNSVPSPSKMTDNNKDYNKTITSTNHILRTTALTLTREEITKEGNKNEGENSFHRKRSPSLEDGGCEVRIIYEGENKAEEVEKLIQEIEAGTFHGDIKVPGDVFLEDELIQRKHGILRRSYNNEFDLRETFEQFGEMGRVMLTDRQYRHLTIAFGQEVADEYIQRLDFSIGANPHYSYHAHYKIIIRWLKEDMQCADAFAPV